MKIGIVTEYHFPSIGGIQDHIHFFHQELRRLGYDTVVFTSEVTGCELPDGEALKDAGRIVRLKQSRIFPANGSAGRITTSTSLVRKFRQALAEERCDLLHIHTPFVPTLPMLALKESRVPTVATFHTNFQKQGDRFIKRFLPFMRLYLQRLDARIAVSRTSAELMKQHFGGQYRVIPNGVDAAGFRSAQPFAEYRDGTINLLFVGRLDPRNGLDNLLAALQLLGDTLPLRLFIMGDGPLRPRYEAMANTLGDGRIVFLGTRLATKARWYATADILCAPMHVASFGMVLIEAMAAGLPIVANHIKGFSDVMQDGEQGLFCDTKNPQSFAKAIATLVTSPELRRTLAQTGLAAAEQFSWQSVTNQILDVYRDTLGLTAMVKRRSA